MKKNTVLMATLILAALFGFAAESAAGTAYKVVRRDTLSRIALRFCGDAGAYRKIAAENGIRNANLIFAGQVLQVSCDPSAAASQAAAKATPATFTTTAIVNGNRTVDIELVDSPSSRLYAKTIPVGDAPNLAHDPRTRKLEQFACILFGADCVTYLALTRSENFTRACNIRSRINDNGTFDTGWAQMNSAHIADYPQFDFSKCEENILASYLHFRRYGFSRWTNFRNGRYREHLAFYQDLVAKWELGTSTVADDEN